jgi:hypothetical protein
MACDESARFHEALDPFAQAAFPVSWAGEATSLNWFDTARELTERWHHQQQIRVATNRPGIMTPELYHPVLDCFVRGLPYAYREVKPEEGTSVRLHITGECGGEWAIVRKPSAWALGIPSEGSVASVVTIPQEIAWRVFTKGIARHDAFKQCDIQGNRELGEVVFQLTAIVG